MSLLEVLIAIFVLSIGLLGVAAVIPVATFEMVEATKADRAAAIGEAVTRDLQVRSMLRPGDWRKPSGSGVMTPRPYVGGPPPYEPRSGHLFGESYALDPLFISEVVKTDFGGTIDDFPYNANTGLGPWTRLQRVTWRRLAGGMNHALNRTVFMWRDDLAFPVPDDPSMRPELLFKRGPAPASPPLKPQNTGNYTWMVTVTPSPEHIDFTDGSDFFTYPENAPLYDVSVVAFYKRDMNPPSYYVGGSASEDNVPAERQVMLSFVGGGLGGGDVLLIAPSAANRDYLKLKPNDWLMVGGGYLRTCYFREDVFTPPPGAYVPAAVPVGVHKWYRVVAVDEEVLLGDVTGDGTPDAYRGATLAGPDWNLTVWNNDFDLNGIPDCLYVATLIDGVIGVHTTTIELDY